MCAREFYFMNIRGALGDSAAYIYRRGLAFMGNLFFHDGKSVVL